MPDVITNRFTDTQPDIDYLAKDFNSFRQLMLDHLSVLVPSWREQSSADLGNALVDVLAYAADYLSYYQDAVATEAYLGTARLRRSVQRHARLLDYFMHEGCNARAWVQIAIKSGQPADIRLPAGVLLLTELPDFSGCTLDESTYRDLLTRMAAQSERSQDIQMFETLHEVQLFPAHNELHFYVANVREDYRLAKGATSTWLVDEVLPPAAPTSTTTLSLPPRRQTRLQKGDVLIFAEVRDPQTGDPAKANRKRRHAVRLTKATYSERAATQEDRVTRMIKIEWSEVDALPFDLHIAPYGNGKAAVSVAYGNIVLADQGRCVTGELLPPVTHFGRYRPELRQLGLTYRVPYVHRDALALSATETLHQDPQFAMPVIELIQRERNIAFASAPRPLLPILREQDNLVQTMIMRHQWNLRRDLLNSDRFALDYMVEMEEGGRAFLRFGFGNMGKPPAPGTELIASYRTGTGAHGNVGADTIRHLIITETLRNRVQAVEQSILDVRNPLPARHGADPEQIEEARLHAPAAFRRSERCITAADYAAMVARYPGVAQAAAQIRPVGAWQLASVFVQRDNYRPLSAGFRTRLLAYLETYRQVGYEIEIRPPYFVPLQIVLDVYLQPGHPAIVTQGLLAKTFSNQEDTDGNKGYFHPANLKFGQPIYLSRIVAKAMAVRGVARVEVQRFGRRKGAPLEDAIMLEPLEIAEVQNDMTHPEYGTIEFKMIETHGYA